MAKKPPKAKPTADDQALASLYGNKGVNAGNALIDKYHLGEAGGLGMVSTDVAGEGGSASLQRYNTLYNQTQGRDPTQQSVLDTMKAGLGGYTSPEYQAQREQMQRGLNSDMATSSATLARSQARGKVYGAAASAQQGNLIKGAQDTKDNMEQDLMVKNIDEMGRRNLEYGNYEEGLNKNEFDRRSQATKGYGDEEAAQRAEELDRQKTNLGQENARVAAAIGATTGAGGTNLAQENTNRAADIEQQGIQALTGAGGSGNAVANATGNIKTQAKARVAAQPRTPYGTIGGATKKVARRA